MSQLTTKKLDVLIVGGGHVGLYAAARLASLGFEVTLLEKKKWVGQRVVCTGIIGKEAFEHYDLPQEHIVGEIRDIRFFSPSGQYFDYHPENSLAKIVNRNQFNRHFENEALKKGVRVHTGISVEKVVKKKTGISVKAEESDGGSVIFEAALLVLATGVNCHLYHSAGIRPPRNFLGAAQIHIPYEEDRKTSIFVGNEISPGAFGWLVPTFSGEARLGLLCEKNPAYYLRKLLDRVKPGWRDDISESQIDLRPVIQGPLEKSFSDRVLVVGEAAGQIKTTTAGGIYYGMLGVDALVETAKVAFKKNRFRSDILSSYDKRWKKIMAEELRLGQYFRNIFSKLSDEKIESLFDKVVQQDILNLVHSKANFDWHRGLIASFAKIPTFERMIRSPF